MQISLSHVRLVKTTVTVTKSKVSGKILSEKACVATHLEWQLPEENNSYKALILDALMNRSTREGLSISFAYETEEEATKLRQLLGGPCGILDFHYPLTMRTDFKGFMMHSFSIRPVERRKIHKKTYDFDGRNDWATQLRELQHTSNTIYKVPEDLWGPSVCYTRYFEGAEAHLPKNNIFYYSEGVTSDMFSLQRMQILGVSKRWDCRKGSQDPGADLGFLSMRVMGYNDDSLCALQLKEYSEKEGKFTKTESDIECLYRFPCDNTNGGLTVPVAEAGSDTDVVLAIDLRCRTRQGCSSHIAGSQAPDWELIYRRCGLEFTNELKHRLTSGKSGHNDITVPKRSEPGRFSVNEMSGPIPLRQWLSFCSSRKKDYNSTLERDTKAILKRKGFESAAEAFGSVLSRGGWLHPEPWRGPAYVTEKYSTSVAVRLVEGEGDDVTDPVGGAEKVVAVAATGEEVSAFWQSDSP